VTGASLSGRADEPVAGAAPTAAAGSDPEDDGGCGRASTRACADDEASAGRARGSGGYFGMEPVMPPGTDRGGRGASLLNMSKRLSVACRSSAKAAAGTTENSVTHATARVIDTTGLHVLETLTPPNSPAHRNPQIAAELGPRVHRSTVRQQ
jgi:hypothetical protein